MPGPLPHPSLWRRLAEFAGLADTLDAASGLAQTAGVTPPAPSPVSPREAAFNQQLAAREADLTRQRQGSRDAIARIFGSAPVQQLGREIAAPFTPPADVTAMAGQLGQHLTQRSNAIRAALPQAAPVTMTGRDELRGLSATVNPLAPLDLMVGAQQDWLPKAIVSQAADAASPGGALLNWDVPVGPALHAMAPLAAKLGGAAHLAGVLPPGFYSRVDRVAEQVGKKGIHPNKLASLLKNGASTEEVAYRGLPELLAAKGNQLITKEELAAHLAAHPPPEIGRTVLGEQPGLKSFEEFASDLNSAAREPLPPNQVRAAYDVYKTDPRFVAQATKYSSYTLPGGEHYRESLTTLPIPPQPDYKQIARDFQVSMAKKYGADEWMLFTDVGQTTQEKYQAWQQLRGQMTPEELARESEVLRPIQATGGSNPEPPAYRGGHFNEPNVLAHARTTERTLSGPAGPPVPPFVEPAPGAAAAEGWTVRVDREDPYNGTRQMTLFDPQGEWAGSRGMTRLTPEEYLHETVVDRAKTAYKQAQQTAAAPTGERGRFVEEVQSDWNQQGKRQGYADPVENSRDLHNAGATLRQAEMDHAARLREITGGHLTADEVLFLSQASEPGDTIEQVLARIPERAHWQPSVERNVPEFQARARGWLEGQAAAGQRSPVSAAWNGMNALGQTQRAVDEAHSAFQTVRQRQMELVPDNPFKETWPDLTLKQQLLDVAGRQDLSWLGFTSGKTQAARYDLGKQVSRLEYDPVHRRLLGYDHGGAQVIDEGADPDQLAEYIGKEPADKLIEKINAHEQHHAYERSQWSVGHETTPEYFHIYDPNGEPLHNYDGSLEWFKSEEAANDRINELLLDSREQMRQSAARDRDPYLPTLSGLDLQVGGEGMTHFYDQLLPKRLEKILKPFGGTVERGGVPVSKEVTEDVPGFSVRDNWGNMRGWWPTQAEADAYIAAPPPQMTSYVSVAGGARAVPATGGRKITKAVDEPAWIARLTPEQKARIRTEGFPLLSFLPPALVAGGAAGAATSQLTGGDDDPAGVVAPPRHWLGASFLPGS